MLSLDTPTVANTSWSLWDIQTRSSVSHLAMFNLQSWLPLPLHGSLSLCVLSCPDTSAASSSPAARVHHLPPPPPVPQMRRPYY